MEGSIQYDSLYLITTSVLYIIGVTNNSFDDSSLPVGRVNKLLHKIVRGCKLESKLVYSTFKSRFRLRTLLYILSWVVFIYIF